MRIGIDLGGTKTEVIALGEDGRVLLRRRVQTPHGDYDATVKRMSTLVTETERDVGCRMTVGHRSRHPRGHLSGHRAGQERQLGVAERQAAVRGPGASARAARSHRERRQLLCVVRSRRWRCGRRLSGVRRHHRDRHRWRCRRVRQSIIGANAIGGEWGHNPLPWPRDDERPGPACYCGRTGCIETFLSGPGLGRDCAIPGETALDARAIAERAADGNEGASAALGRYEDRLARSLAHVINIIDPEVIVLGGGGGLSNIDRLYDTVPGLWSSFVFSDRVDTRLVRAAHGDSSGVRGAAWLWSVDEARALGARG